MLAPNHEPGGVNWVMAFVGQREAAWSKDETESQWEGDDKNKNS